MKVRYDGGRLLDLTDGSVSEASLLVDDVTQTILAIGTDLPDGQNVVSLSGAIIVPGFVDVHVHLRDPGLTHKETIGTGSNAAAAGGFTQIACMPNTNPPLDNPEVLRYVMDEAKAADACTVWPIACITEGQRGEVLTDFAALKAAGAVALSDDGKGVQHGGLMRRALAEARKFNLPIAIHAEDETLSGDGVLHQGAARRLGLPDIPASAESAMIARDLLLAEEMDAHLHVCHVSVESAVSLIRWAKARGIRVTAEVAPHHLLLTEDIIESDEAVYKVNPPLRSERDRLACLEGFLDGTLDMIATDHAPHTLDEKSLGIGKAPFGMVGIETVFPLLYTHLVLPGLMTLPELVKRMSTYPAQAFGLKAGVVRVGGRADFTAIAIDDERAIQADGFASKGRNTPFTGWHATGWPLLTVRGGRVMWKRQG